MVSVSTPQLRPGASVRATSIAAITSLAVLALGLRVADPSRLPGLENFLLVFSSLLIEAVPFVLLGALVSAIIEVFVPISAFEKLARLPKPMQLPLSGLAGIAFPVCECGSVPVARRLAAKGLSPAAAVTFMLAAPILNPIVIVSTVIAYRGRNELMPMVIGRVSLGFLAAIAVGWVVSGRAGDLLRVRPGESVEEDHHHEHEGSRIASFFGHLTGDFTFMAKFLVFGAIAAAALQTFVPQSVIGGIAGTPVLDIVALMALAFMLSLCSESDAFVAASFVQFGLGAQLAFLVFGPLIDTKLGFLYNATFSKGFLRTAVLVVGAVTIAGTLWIEVLFG